MTLRQGLRVTAPAPNPRLPPRCGIDVMLVLDESDSIETSGATEQVRDAVRTFLDALSGTGAAVAIVDFSTGAGWPVGYTTVTPGSIATVFEPYLVDGYAPNGWTNWEAAFDTVHEANAQGTRAETRPLSARRLTAVSGFDRYPQTGFGDADYTLIEDFADLAQGLRDIATELCEGSVTVTKVVDEGDRADRPAPGWRFTASVSVPGGFTWVQPPPPTPAGSRSQTTDDDGIATFQWTPTDPTAISTVSMTELVTPGYELVDHTCSTSAPGRTRTRITRGTTSRGIATGTIRPKEYAKCTVRNRVLPGTIDIDPAVPPGPPTPPSPPVPPAPPEPPGIRPATVLSVVKTAPPVARVGDRVAFDLTVTNTGPVAAQNVTVASIPPAALTLAGLRSPGGAPSRTLGRSLLWRLGTLAPGESRVVRGTVRVEAGTPGLRRNYALAGAENAELAQDDVDTRVLARPPIIPPVTG